MIGGGEGTFGSCVAILEYLRPCRGTVIQVIQCIHLLFRCHDVKME